MDVYDIYLHFMLIKNKDSKIFDNILFLWFHNDVFFFYGNNV